MSIPRPIAHLILNAFRGQPFSMTGLYAAAFITVPGTDGDPAGHEPVGFGYSRVAVTFAVPNFGSMGAGTVTFPTATGSWGTITRIGFCDQLTGGQVVGYSNALSPSRTILPGNTLRINSLWFQIA